MLWVDIAILVIVGISALISVMRGLVKEVLSLVAWVLAFWVAIIFSSNIAVMLEAHVSTESVRNILAFLSLFIGTLLLMGLVNLLISKLMDSTGLTGTDRALGVIFGVLRGVAIVLVLVLLAGLTPVPEDPWWQQSIFLGHFESLALQVVAILPPDISQHFKF